MLAGRCVAVAIATRASAYRSVCSRVSGTTGPPVAASAERSQVIRTRDTDPSNDAAQLIDSRAYRTFPNALTSHGQIRGVPALPLRRRSEATERKHRPSVDLSHIPAAGGAACGLTVGASDRGKVGVLTPATASTGGVYSVTEQAGTGRRRPTMSWARTAPRRNLRRIRRALRPRAAQILPATGADDDAAEDIVQETFIAAWNQGPRSAATRRSDLAVREIGTRKVLDCTAGVDPTSSTTKSSTRSRSAQARTATVVSSNAFLNASTAHCGNSRCGQRASWVMREVESMTFPEIGKVLGLSPDAARGQHRRAAATLAVLWKSGDDSVARAAHRRRPAPWCTLTHCGRANTGRHEEQNEQHEDRRNEGGHAAECRRRRRMSRNSPICPPPHSHPCSCRSARASQTRTIWRTSCSG